MNTLDKQLVEGVTDYIDAAGRRWVYLKGEGILTLPGEQTWFCHPQFPYVSIPGLKPLVEKPKCTSRHEVLTNLYKRKINGDWIYFCNECGEIVDTPRNLWDINHELNEKFAKALGAEYNREKCRIEKEVGVARPEKATRTVTFEAWVNDSGDLFFVDPKRNWFLINGSQKRFPEFDMTREVTV